MAKRTQPKKKHKLRRCLLTFQDDNDPDISLYTNGRRDPYAAQRQQFWNRLNLGKKIAALTKIYLDTKFWIYLRDAFLNRPQQTSHAVILDMLIALCESKKVICPIFEPHISELERQDDEETRLATANIMDKLSGSVCLSELMELRRRESLHFFSERRSFPIAYNLSETVWTKTPFYLGDLHLRVSKQLDGNYGRKVSRLANDYIWNNVSLSDFVRFQNQDKDKKKLIDDTTWGRLAVETTEGKFDHMKDDDTFRALYRDESQVFMDYAYVNIPAFYLIAWNKELDTQSMVFLRNNAATALAKEIREHLCDTPKARTCLSSFDIHTGLHAAVRLDRGKGYKTNDFADFRHAVGALGYCDYFFTEKSLCHLLTNKPLEYDKKYGCTVVADENSILNILDSLI